jgi:polysaccharide pyruvyl transferase WcaK-like protein
MSQFFVTFALSLADFRSYRDALSSHHVAEIGFPSVSDAVYPDLAFSLSSSAPEPETSPDPRALVVAVGLKDYHGQYDYPRPQNPKHRPFTRATSATSPRSPHGYATKSTTSAW